jgi:hypothetical protein
VDKFSIADSRGIINYSIIEVVAKRDQIKVSVCQGDCIEHVGTLQHLNRIGCHDEEASRNMQ